MLFWWCGEVDLLREACCRRSSTRTPPSRLVCETTSVSDNDRATEMNAPEPACVDQTSHHPVVFSDRFERAELCSCADDDAGVSTSATSCIHDDLSARLLVSPLCLCQVPSCTRDRTCEH